MFQIEDAMLMFDKQTNRHRGKFSYSNIVQVLIYEQKPYLKISRLWARQAKQPSFQRTHRLVIVITALKIIKTSTRLNILTISSVLRKCVLLYKNQIKKKNLVRSKYVHTLIRLREFDRSTSINLRRERIDIHTRYDVQDIV